ncbi:MAG: hypothetical protein ACN4GZ_14350 [Acidimicrobiales bacterium]
MNRRNVGLGILAIGFVMMVAGVIGMLTASDDEPADVVAPTTSAPASISEPPSTTAAPAATTVAPAATTTTTTAPAETTTSTTTTTEPPPSVADFILAYAAATETGDGSFLADRILPAVRDVFGEDLCRGWVDREILAISGYQLTGTVTGPLARTLTIGETVIAVEQYYEAPVSFMFQGEPFETVATFAAVDGEVYWIGECR